MARRQAYSFHIKKAIIGRWLICPYYCFLCYTTRTKRVTHQILGIVTLNAAIEAAHAGEYGRGFDIVAKEVRVLAGQVQNATVEVSKHTESIIKQITKIGEGTNRSNTAIVDGRQRIEQAMSEFNNH
ncbi:methyl-accepting chemotaxis protein [Paenibacillus sp. S-38]|uniref:methyl-accepting chemotaxis protein n=1 Tax=Paenibacillus sp. S-38 TaxID=3416710 RepID=UPI003CEE71FC